MDISTIATQQVAGTGAPFETPQRPAVEARARSQKPAWLKAKGEKRAFHGTIGPITLDFEGIEEGGEAETSGSVGS